MTNKRKSMNTGDDVHAIAPEVCSHCEAMFKGFQGCCPDKSGPPRALLAMLQIDHVCVFAGITVRYNAMALLVICWFIGHHLNISGIVFPVLPSPQYFFLLPLSEVFSDTFSADPEHIRVPVGTEEKHRHPSIFL